MSMAGEHSQSASPPATSRHKPKPISKFFCMICDGPASKYNYSVLSCNACRQFFKRIVHRDISKKLPVCRTGKNSCEITAKNRKECISCRYARCIANGMRPDLVGIRGYTSNTSTAVDNSSHERQTIKRPISAVERPATPPVPSKQPLPVAPYVPVPQTCPWDGRPTSYMNCSASNTTSTNGVATNFGVNAPQPEPEPPNFWTYFDQCFYPTPR